MTRVLTITALLASTLFGSAALANQAGDFEPIVNTHDIVQVNQGSENENFLRLGTIDTGQNPVIGVGNFKPIVTTQDVVQINEGSDNLNSIRIGTLR